VVQADNLNFLKVGLTGVRRIVICEHDFTFNAFGVQAESFLADSIEASFACVARKRPVDRNRTIVILLNSPPFVRLGKILILNRNATDFQVVQVAEH
jgi:hypothetical protein